MLKELSEWEISLVFVYLREYHENYVNDEVDTLLNKFKSGNAQLSNLTLSEKARIVQIFYAVLDTCNAADIDFSDKRDTCLDSLPEDLGQLLRDAYAHLDKVWNYSLSDEICKSATNFILQVHKYVYQEYKRRCTS